MARPGKYDHLKPEVRALYETGHKKAIQLSKEYNIPRNTLSRWINEEGWTISEQTNEAITKSVEVMEHLAEQSSETQKAVSTIVEQKTKHLELITNVQAFAVSLIGKKMKAEGEKMSMYDIKTGVEATDKAAISLGVAQRHANSPQVAIQNNMTQNNSIGDLSEEEIEKELKARGLPIDII